MFYPGPDDVNAGIRHERIAQCKWEGLYEIRSYGKTSRPQSANAEG